MSERRNRTAIVSVRFTADELERAQERADRAGLLISTYLREVAIGGASTPKVGAADYFEDGDRIEATFQGRVFTDSTGRFFDVAWKDQYGFAVRMSCLRHARNVRLIEPEAGS